MCALFGLGGGRVSFSIGNLDFLSCSLASLNELNQPVRIIHLAAALHLCSIAEKDDTFLENVVATQRKASAAIHNIDVKF